MEDPLLQLKAWIKEADEAEIYEPNAMVVSTIDRDGEPSSRTVLLRAIDETGLYFYTDYGSRKGLALLSNSSVSLVFPWYAQHRQVIVFGSATPTDPAISDAYFESRPRGSQVGAWASDQSHPIASRAELESKVREIEKKFEGENLIPRPESWGGFVVTPVRIEFWAGRTSRLHDRICFLREGQEWTYSRLQP